jgi:Mg2+ and Co2+ transporter CorA
MDFSLAETATQQAIAADKSNSEARRLNRLVAFFFPLATLVSVFGMNEPVKVYTSAGFWIILLSGIVLGFIVHALVAASHKK